ncbi:hypothetical protein DL769_006717 [Monosporascus sp. CRB-8-3]|nr:hypothetical protein DL769_006717 [Monosporascus sp. CRB-8-3]
MTVWGTCAAGSCRWAVWMTGQPHADGAYLFWALVCALGMLLLGLWGPETRDVPMEGMEELFGGPWWKTWRVRVDLAAAAPPPGSSSSAKDSMEKARHSEPAERVWLVDRYGPVYFLRIRRDLTGTCFTTVFAFTLFSVVRESRSNVS